uniref:Uncharacterized protein n=1 Tax=Panagrolaimus sp. ES5 TaxID=591445 RepID=A0AC34G0K4_9BILA
MIEYPFAAEWEIPEYKLRFLQNSIKNDFDRLISQEFTAINSSGVKYYLTIHPNGDKPENRGKSKIRLYVKLGNENKVEAEYKFTIESANWSYKINYIYDRYNGYGIPCCIVNKLFDPKKKFIVDERCTVKVKGIFKIKNNELPPKGIENFCGLWNKGYEDFSIVVDKKEIKVC